VEVLNISEQEYRGINIPSYSLLKAINDSGPKVINSPKEFSSDSIDLGSLVDCIIFTPDEVDNRFYSKPIEKPTAQVLQLADSLFEGLQSELIEPSDIQLFQENEYKLVFDKISELSLFGNIKDLKKVEAKFNTPLFWNYLKALIDANGKTIISPELMEEANEIVTNLKMGSKTSKIFNNFSAINPNKVLNQLQFIIEVEGKAVKGMLDTVIIDHVNKKIKPYDLKVTEYRQKSFKYQFKSMKYYLQAALYQEAMHEFKDNNYPDYEVENFRFIVYSRSDRYGYIWQVSDEWLQVGFNGDKENNIVGIKELLKDYYYYVENEEFVIERDIFENPELIIEYI
jgi:hypothetical protein